MLLKQGRESAQFVLSELVRNLSVYPKSVGSGAQLSLELLLAIAKKAVNSEWVILNAFC
jgi:hypothetical protein